VLAFSSISSAATFTYNVTGPNGYVFTISSLGNTTTPFSTGSSVSVDITGNVATFLGGTLNINGVTSVPGVGSVTTNVVVTMSGGTGVLNGDDILWDISGPTFIDPQGTFSCSGTLVCQALGNLTAGQLYPIAQLGAASHSIPVNPIIMGTWDLTADLMGINGSSRAVITLGGPNPPPGPGLPAQWYVFGATDLGKTIPEPGAFALVLLGIGGLGLRGRKA